MTDLITHFDELHAAAEDPWQVMTSWYERRKRALTMAALPRVSYRSAFEPGCSIGALSELLAERCDELLALDAAPAAVERCRERTAGLPHVRVELGRLPHDCPPGPFDLVVLSEVAYYLDPDDVGETVDRCTAALEPGGHLVAVHWREVADDFRTPGRTVHDLIGERVALTRLATYEDQGFQLDVFERQR